jgi:hypothetical protein
MADRVLGETRTARAVCATILCFTGNNIVAKGDLASRALEARITVDRPDPENRRFEHSDPFGWTLDRRAEIVAALYVILRGNPKLREKAGGESTRFKLWHRLVGSAIEHAAELAGRGVDFAKLFQASEEKDEDATTLAESLQRLDRLAGGKPFRAAHALTWAEGEGEDATALRGFLGSSVARPLAANGIARRLNAVTDAPTRVGAAVWTLRSERPLADKITRFWIDKR